MTRRSSGIGQTLRPVAIAMKAALCMHAGSSRWQWQHAGAYSGFAAINNGGAASIATEVRPTDAPAALGALTPDVHKVVLQPAGIGVAPSLTGSVQSGTQVAQPQAPAQVPTAIPPTAEGTPDSGIPVQSPLFSGNGGELAVSTIAGQVGELRLSPALDHAFVVHAPDTPATITSGRYNGAAAYSLE